MKITLNKYEVSLGKKRYKVLTPIVDFPDFYVLNRNDKSAMIFGNESSLEIFENLLLVAADLNDSIIFIRSKRNQLTEYLSECWSGENKGNDLVLLHHSIQFKTNDWKEVRKLLLKSKEVSTEEITINTHINEQRDLSKYWFQEHKDFLDIGEHYETLFLIGSRDVFVNIADDTNSVKLEGRDLYQCHPGFHAHEHIDYYARRVYTKNFKHAGWSLCLDYYDSELWER